MKYSAEQYEEWIDEYRNTKRTPQTVLVTPQTTLPNIDFKRATYSKWVRSIYKQQKKVLCSK